MKYKNTTIEQWIESYSGALLNRAFYLISDKEDAQDIVQEVFMAALVRYDSFQHKSNPLTWLNAILQHKIADFYRKKYKNPIAYDLSSFFDENGLWKDPSVAQPWEEPSKEETEQALHQCIEKLPERWRIPVKLYYLKEKKNEEVCQEMGITPTNLWKILQRSRLQLRECLEKNKFV